jgi:hypothetical protein
MKTKFFAALLALALVGTACVSTVSGRKTAGVPFLKDTIQARYEKPLDQVYGAALEVIRSNGTLVSEGILHELPGETNTTSVAVKTLEGRVNERTIYVRVRQTEPPITDVSVQARTQGGGSDIDLASQISTQIALKLAR